MHLRHLDVVETSVQREIRQLSFFYRHWGKPKFNQRCIEWYQDICVSNSDIILLHVQQCRQHRWEIYQLAECSNQTFDEYSGLIKYSNSRKLRYSVQIHAEVFVDTQRFYIRNCRQNGGQIVSLRLPIGSKHPYQNQLGFTQN